MKLNKALTFGLGLMLAGNISVNAQKVTFNGEQVSLKQAFERIESVSNYKIAYNATQLDVNKTVTLNQKDVDVLKVLDVILAGTGCTYKINDWYIVITPVVTNKNSVKKIEGTVKDAAGMPVIGATVMVKGTTNGTITDFDGNFSLEAEDGANLEISYIGYQSQQLKASAGKLLAVTLKEDTEVLDEVVVVGYGVQKKANLTGAVSSVKMDEILGERPISSVSEALLGAMPGLQVTGTSGQPGAEMSFNIRGTNSINGGTPLVLVDNVEMDLNMLNPEDIESVSVLKDAAASAIYGARAAFGVILVTTKKGTTDSSVSINYSNNFSFSRPANMPHKASPRETVQAYKDMGWVNYRSGENIETWLGLLDDYESNPSKYPGGYTTIDGLRYQLHESDIFDDMLETGFQQTHNLSVSGGTKTLSYRMSAGIVKQDGVLVTNKDSYNRYNISSYIRSDVYSWITPELDVKYTNLEASIPHSVAPYGIWGAAAAFPSYFQLGDYEMEDGTVLPINTPRNHIINGAPKISDKDNLRIFGKVTITPFKDLKIIGEYTFNRKNSELSVHDKKYEYADGNGNFARQTSTANSKYEVTTGTTDYTALNVYGNYNKTFGKHDLGIMAGFNQETYSFHEIKSARWDMINEDLPSLSQGTGAYENKEKYSEYNVRGLFYRLNYSYAGKYLFETNGRYDGSSKFPSKNRFGFFPSFSAGWRVSEENFMNWSESFLSNLKLRVSWGNIGNQSVDPYQFVPSMEAERPNWVVDGSKPTTLLPPALVSNTFTWEKVSTLDFGFDLGLLNNRLNLTFDWYRRDTKGMLAPGMELPGVLGAKAPMQNTADLRSDGWELSVDWNDRIGNVSYYLGFNLYDSRTKITKYDNASQLLGKDGDGNPYYREGMYLGEIWGYDTDRLYTVDDFDESGVLKPGIPKVEGYNPNPGDVLYVDHNDDGIINNGTNTGLNPGDMRIIGNSTRRYQYGIRGGTSWKGLSLSFILQGVGKRDMWIMNELFYPQFDEFSTIYSSQLDYWTPNNTDSYFPRLYQLSKGNTAANRNVQTRYLQNGAYLSIRNVTLSYNLPKKWLTSWGAKNLQVFFSGENLFTFDHLPEGLDPERTVTDDLGSRGFTYPYMRQYSFGINLTF